jgi:hypothetical protein
MPPVRRTALISHATDASASHRFLPGTISCSRIGGEKCFRVFFQPLLGSFNVSRSSFDPAYVGR